MWSVEYPSALLLLLLIPPLVYLAHVHPGRGGKIRFSYRVYGGRGFRPRFSAARLILLLSRLFLWIGIVLLIAALAEPVWVQRQKVYLSRGTDIMIVLDESPSMLAQDFEPRHRFGAAKKVIRSFVVRRENDQIGLVSFSDRARLRSPPTVDYGFLLETLETIEVEGLKDGTAIGMGMSLGSLHLQAGASSSRVIILLTDGENNAGEITPEAAADLARELGIRIYTIGIGREGEAYLEVKDPDTGRIIKGMYRGEFDEALLEQIAEVSGGKYYHATSPGTLSAVFDQIDSVEKTETRVRFEVSKRAYHVPFLLIGLSCVLVFLVLSRGFLRELL